MIYRELADNPLENRKDVERALESLISPLIPHFSRDNTFLIPGSTGAHYKMNSAGFEGFSRPFWGIVPTLAGTSSEQGLEAFLAKSLEGFKCGIDPRHENYWGDSFDFDQKLVEMAILGLSLVLYPDLFWNSLDPQQQDNLRRWMEQVNNHSYPQNNWLFFRVFVNLGLNSVCRGGSDRQVEEDLETLDSFYLGDGWYSDGKSEQMDYYISFAMHFYGMLYAGLREEEDPERSRIFRERAALFAGDFIKWFSRRGDAVPFGRSQTYRFAQGSFWAAAAFCRLYEICDWLTPGIVKGMILRHLRWWFRQPMFSESGLLTVGYAYPNLIMSESYNAPGSPYWAFKSFFILALPEDSPFWAADEETYPFQDDDVSLQPYPRFLLCRQGESGDVTILNGGQYAAFPTHNLQKYGKFSYSNQFAFSVPTGSCDISRQAGDNSLMIRTEEGLWLHRGRTVNHRYNDRALSSDWVIRNGLAVRTILTWIEGKQVRFHLIKSDRDLEFCEGGSACPVDEDRQQMNAPVEGSLAGYRGKGLYSMIGNLELPQIAGSVEAWLIQADPNTNLLFPRTVIPSLIRKQNAGIALWGTVLYAAHSDGGGEKNVSPLSVIDRSGSLSVVGKSDIVHIPAEWLDIAML